MDPKAYVKEVMPCLYSESLFFLIQYNAQYVGKLNRYFNQVVGDFGPYQTIQMFNPVPISTFNKGDFGCS
jgi:hypothetical protein